MPTFITSQSHQQRKNPEESLAEDEPSGQSSRGKLNLNRKKGTASTTEADLVSEPFDARCPGKAS